MSQRRPNSPLSASPAPRVRSGSGRLPDAWRNLSPEHRLAIYASLGLFVTLFLPWYQETVIARGTTTLQRASESLTGWSAFSFVEAAVLVVACGVIALLFVRAEGRPFRVPFGDGGVITAAGFWTCVLIVWRIFDKQGTSGQGQLATTSGIEWGIFVALAVAAFLAYAGSRIRASTAADDLSVAPAASRPERSAQRRQRTAATAERGSEPEEVRPRRPRVERMDRDLFEDVDTDWPERPTEPRLTRRRMTDDELRSGAEPQAASRAGNEDPAAADRPSPDAGAADSASDGGGGGEPASASDVRTRRITPPSTPAARRARDADEQLTMPLERDD